MEKTKSKKEKKSPKETEKNYPPAVLESEPDYKLTVVKKKLHVVDNRTGKTINVNTVEDLQKLGVSLGEASGQENSEWTSPPTSIQDFSPNQLSSLKNILSEMGPTAQRSLIEEAIEKSRRSSDRDQTVHVKSFHAKA
jgi:hypothetical protein